MKFYRIRHTLDEKQIGKYPQIKDVFYSDVAFGNPKFIGEIRFTKVECNPVIPSPILNKKAIKTDLIEEVASTPFNMIISGMLKDLIEAKRKNGIQFFQTSVFHNGIEDFNYWVTHMYIGNNEFIDYKNSLVTHRQKKKEEYGTISISIKFEDKDAFTMERQKATANFEAFYIEKLVLHDVTEDFFMLRDIDGGAGFFVSEKLKQEIEEAGCTGIEFQPSELSYNEWLAPGGEREKVYGKSW